MIYYFPQIVNCKFAFHLFIVQALNCIEMWKFMCIVDYLVFISTAFMYMYKYV